MLNHTIAAATISVEVVLFIIALVRDSRGG